MPPSKPPPLQFANHQQYIKRYKEAKTYDEFARLQKEVQAEENRYRELFAKSRSSKTLQDEYLMMIPVFKNFDSFGVRSKSPEEDKTPTIFEPKTRPPAASPATVKTAEEFARNFNLFTENMLKTINWDNIFVAGGSVLAALLPIPEQYDKNNATRRQYYHTVAYKTSDVDLFVYGLDEEKANQKMEEIYKHISDNLHVDCIAFRSQHAVTIVSQYPYRHVQIVLRLYKSPAEVLMGFDVDSCAMGYDGKNVYVMPRCHQALVSRYNTIDMSRRSPSYEMRLAKYSARGFGVIVPFLERKKVDPQIFERGFDQVNGLARLLLLERLATPEARTQFKNQQRLRQLRPQYERRGSFWDMLNSRFSGDEYVRERAGEGSSVASDYSTVFLPWGPKWTATRVRHIMYTKDLILNSTWYDEDKKVHTHPCFFGTASEILNDCCGTCPPEPIQPGPDPVTGFDNPFVRGPLTWVTVNPGAQTIGSFHPITDGDWTEGAYIDPRTEKLCLAVNADDIGEVTRLIYEGAGVDSRDALGRTPLVIAALNNSVESAKMLIRSKAWVSLKIAGGRTALHIAAQYGHVEIAQMILQRGVELKELKAQTDAANALLAKMNIQKDKDALKDFVVVGKKKKKGGDDDDDEGDDEDEEMEDPDEDGGDDEGDEDDDDEGGGKKKMKQGMAIIKGTGDEPKEDILEVDGKDNDMEMTPLQYSAFFGWTDTAEVLIKFGASLEKMVEAGQSYQKQTISLLYLSTLCDNMDTFKFLLTAGAPINQMDSEFNTVLHLVTKDQKENFVKAVVSSKSKEPIKVNQLNKSFESALHIAVGKKNTKIAQLLINQGALVNFTEKDYTANNLQHGTDFKYFTPVIFKSYDESDANTDMLKFLLDNGAKINIKKDTHSFFDFVTSTISTHSQWHNTVFAPTWTLADVTKAVNAAGKNTYFAWRLMRHYSHIINAKNAKKDDDDGDDEDANKKYQIEEAEKENEKLKKKIDFAKCVQSKEKGHGIVANVLGSSVANMVLGYNPHFPTQPSATIAGISEITRKIDLLLDPCSYLHHHNHANATVDQDKAWKLFEAAYAGDVALINKLTANNGMYVALRDVGSGNTPLHAAAMNNNYDAIIRLIEIAQEQYVPVPLVEEEDKTTIQINNYDLVAKMHHTVFIPPKKKFKVDPNKIDLNVYTHSPSELILATNQSRYNIIHILAAKGASDSIHALLEIFEDIDNIPLADTIDKADYIRPSVPSALISHHSNDNNYIPFEVALINGHLDAARILLHHAGWLPQVMSDKQMVQKQKDNEDGYYTGLNVGGKKMSWASDFYGKGAKKSKNRVLFLASYFNQVPALKFLLEGEAYDLFIQGQLRKQINDEGKKKKDKQKKTSKKQKVTATLSVSKPQAKFDPIPLDADRVNKIKVIFKGWNLDDKDKKENTVFHSAATGDSADAVKYLAQLAIARKLPALINAGTKKKSITPLYLAAHQGSVKALQALVENGGDVAARDTSLGWTPLHAAVSNRKIEAVKILIEAIKKAKKDELIDAHGNIHQQTPLMIALVIDSSSSPQKSYGYGYKHNKNQNKQKTSEDGLAMAKVLLDAGASVLEQDMDGNSALHVITKKSVDYGLDSVLAAAEKMKKKDLVVTENSLGLTPLDYARIAILKKRISKSSKNHGYWHQQKQEKKDATKKDPTVIFSEKLQQLAQSSNMRRVAVDPVRVRDMIEMALAHSNLAVEKARLKAEQNKFQYNPYHDEEEDYEDEDDELGSFEMQQPDYEKYLEDHAPIHINVKPTKFDTPALIDLKL